MNLQQYCAVDPCKTQLLVLVLARRLPAQKQPHNTAAVVWLLPLQCSLAARCICDKQHD